MRNIDKITNKLIHRIEGMIKVMGPILTVEEQERVVASMNIFQNSLQNVYNCYVMLDNEMMKRSKSVGKQIATLDFIGELHEEYHTINVMVNTAFDNFFKATTTFVNIFPAFIASGLLKDDQRGIKTKSFTAFLSSINQQIISKSIRDPKLLTLFRHILERGRELDEKYNDFRDDYIEHIHPNKPESKYSVTNHGNKRIYHDDQIIKQDELEDNHKMELEDEGGGFVSMYMTRDEWDGSEIPCYYVHVRPYKNYGADESGRISRGNQMMKAEDYDTGHFNKYGVHTHWFGDGNLDSVESLFQVGPERIYVSPEPHDAVNDICKYIRISCDLLKEYISHR